MPEADHTVTLIVRINQYGSPDALAERVPLAVHRQLYQQYHENFDVRLEAIGKGHVTIPPVYEDEHDKFFWVPRHLLVKRPDVRCEECDLTIPYSELQDHLNMHLHQQNDSVDEEGLIL